MSLCVYLDDYNRIRIDGVNPDFCGNFDVFEDGRKIGSSIESHGDCRELYLNEDIHPENRITVSAGGSDFTVIYRLITHTERFEEEYIPDLSTLGSFYTKEQTVFRFWAPFSDSVELVLNDTLIPMEKKEKGVYEITIKGNLEKTNYHFIIVKNGIRNSYLDPFAYVKNFNDIDSIVIDTKKLNKEKTEMETFDFPVVYECSVRDFSSYPGIFEHPGKFIAFKEEGLRHEGESVGLDYLKSLGITHVQLMPVLDYDNDHSIYNWGYNPINYNYFKDEYLMSSDPYEKIEEVRSTFETLHKNNLRVILDVVFNHVYSAENFILNRILPYYFYRYSGTERSNGAGLGNELRTESLFVRSYLKLLMKRLVEVYGIDGLRYDLSGLVDIETVKEIHNECKTLNPDFITICEGWNMGDTLKKEEACNFENAERIKEAFFFNSYFRDTLKGTNEKPGFLFGNAEMREDFKKAFACEDYYLDQNQSLNYTECHDDATLYDWLMKRGNGESFEYIALRAMFALSLTVLARGIPFVQSGQEFLRSKNGIDNTYNAPDEINRIDWKRRKYHGKQAEIFKELIATRKKINDYYTKEYTYTDYYELIVMNIEDLRILINPCPYHHIYTDGSRYETIFDGKERVSVKDKGINVDPYTVVVAKRIENQGEGND